MLPWNDWYHCMGNIYGTWLPGDHRGFRTRNDKLHVPYDYKHRPPKGTYDRLYERSKRLMTYPTVYLDTPGQRQRVLDEFVASLLRHHVELAILSIDRVHFHALARLPDHNPRRWIGLAKKESSQYCKQTGHAPEGGLWGAACECKPVEDESHYHAAFGYIADHAVRRSRVAAGRAAPALRLQPRRPARRLTVAARTRQQGSSRTSLTAGGACSAGRSPSPAIQVSGYRALTTPNRSPASPPRGAPR